MKRFVEMLSGFAAALVLGSCALTVPFDVTVDGGTMNLPTTGGAYVEEVVSSPEDTQNSRVSFDSLTLNYTIVNNTAFTGEIEVYVGLDQAADGDASDATLIIRETVAASGTVTGSVSPEILKSAVKQPQFVVGLKNVSVSGIGGSDITLGYSIRATGEYRLW